MSFLEEKHSVTSSCFPQAPYESKTWDAEGLRQFPSAADEGSLWEE